MKMALNDIWIRHCWSIIENVADGRVEYEERDKIDESQTEKCSISNSDAMSTFDDGCIKMS